MKQKTFSCSKCGECCRNFGGDRAVLLTAMDITKISNYFGMNGNSFRDQYCESSPTIKEITGFSVIKLISRDGNCVFIGDDNLCIIQAVKPFQCAISPEFLLKRAMARDFECMAGLASEDDPIVEEQFVVGVLGAE